MGDAAARVTEAASAPALDRFFDTFYRQRPVAATFTGLHHHDAMLPDWSATGLARAADQMRALRRDLDAAGGVPDEAVTIFPSQADLALADYKVRILDGNNGTAATTRVLIDTQNGTKRWSTVGASANIIEASWRALADAVEYGLTVA